MSLVVSLSLQNISSSCFGLHLLGFGHIRLVSFLVYFTWSFFSNFHFGRCNLFYAHLCVCNFVIFCYRVQHCVMTACSSI